jgi:hypothetical protein
LIIGGGPPGGRTNVCGGSIPSPSALMFLVESAPRISSRRLYEAFLRLSTKYPRA